MDFVELLKSSAQDTKSIVCMGVDPVIEKIPVKKGTIEFKIEKFYAEIVDAFVSQDVFPSAFKPNYAFFAQYGFEGLRALEGVIQLVQLHGLPVIFDGKRGDIGATAKAYAKEAFEFWKADAVTIPPFMGFDSVQPFVEWAESKGKGVYILNRTSNPGAKDLQMLDVGSKKVFSIVSEKIVEWGSNAKGNVGAVVGATSPNELEEINSFFSKNSKNVVPLLIPGVGRQGGSAKEVSQILKKSENLEIHRINVSSGINYAYLKQETDDFAGAAVKALKKLNKEIGNI